MSETRDTTLFKEEEKSYGTARSMDFDMLEEEADYGMASSVAKSMDPDLYIAATKGEIIELCKAMEQGPADRYGLPASCIQVSPQKNTILHIATSFRHHMLVKVICEDLPSFIRKKNYRGDTALHIAARSDDLLLITLLINSINDESGEAILGEKNEEGNTALHEALCHRHEKVAWILFDKNRRMSYSVNKEGKSPLYMAAEAGYAYLAKLIMQNSVKKQKQMGKSVGNDSADQERPKNRSPVHAAIQARNIDVLDMMWKEDKSTFNCTCEEGRNPLHYAASIGYLEGVSFLLDKFCVAAYQRDNNGVFPIHLASSEGHIDIIQEFLQLCPDSRELLNQEGQNMLHVAAKNGRANAVSYMLQRLELENLINERDEDGNTPLHLATIPQNPKTVSILTWDQRVNLELVNKEGLTALDIAEEYNGYMETMASFRKRLTWVALKVAGAPAQPKVLKSRRQNSAYGDPSKLECYKDKVTIILLVATLVATVTFSAGFTIPGGEDNSNPDQGMATMLMQKMFHVFVICNTIAMYTSIIVAVTLIWWQLGDLTSVFVTLKLALPLLGLALTMMSIAFMAGLYLVVSKLTWLANAVLLMGVVFLVMLVTLLVPLCLLGSSDYCILRYISYYYFHLLFYTIGRYLEDDLEE